MWIRKGLAAAWIMLLVVSNASSQEAATGWSTWGNWVETCQHTCGSVVRGIQSRERNCTTTTRCTGEKIQTRMSVCNVPACPVDGGFTQWTDWTNPPCSPTCNATRVFKRFRTCTNPSPAFGGAFCSGSPMDTTTDICNNPGCIEDNWTYWEAWTPTCPATCGNSVTGMKSRTRTCNSTSGTGCQGPNNQTEVTQCKVPACTVNGSSNMVFQTPLLAALILVNLLAY
ncbi:mucin-like protein [Haliotis rubra]|uniref:mucin-like protein n=1 Tax=Haliotis rubra TaxID=36100 RepID=UPI001EE535C0|nr:mucin-like protein [Haliotis rubra]